MNNHIRAISKYLMVYHKDAKMISIVIICILALLLIIVLFLRSNMPKIVYQPTVGCELFTSIEAKELLGSRVIQSTNSKPVISENTATSKCGYADGNPDMNNVLVAAVVVRSGINDEGSRQNRTEFIAGKPEEHVSIVNNVGDKAYFNENSGQLNILDDHAWIIVSYGLGSDPGANRMDDAVTLAKRYLRLEKPIALPSF